MRHYMIVFGIERERVNSLNDVDHSLLKCTYLLKPNINMVRVVVTKIELILPLVGSVIISVTTAKMTYMFLESTLHDIKYDALLIYEHIVNTNADHRM